LEGNGKLINSKQTYDRRIAEYEKTKATYSRRSAENEQLMKDLYYKYSTELYCVFNK